MPRGVWRAFGAFFRCGACAEGFAKPIGKPLNLCSRCPARTTSLLGVSLQIFTVLGMASFLMIAAWRLSRGFPMACFHCFHNRFLMALEWFSGRLWCFRGVRSRR